MVYKNYSLLKPSKSKISINRWYGLNYSSNLADSEFSEMKNITSDGYNVCARPPREVIKDNIESPQMLFFCGDKLSYVSQGKLYVDNGEEFTCAGEVGNATSVVDFNNRKMLFYPTDMVYDYKKGTVEQTMETLKKTDCGDNIVKVNSTWSCYGLYLTADDDLNSEYITLTSIKDDEGKDVKDEKGYVKYPVISIHCSDSPYFYNDNETYKKTLFVEAWGYDKEGKEKCLTSNAYTTYQYWAFDFGQQIAFDNGYAAKLKVIAGYCKYTKGGAVLECNSHCLKAKNADVDEDSTTKYWIAPSDYPAPNSRPYIKYACMDNNRVIGVAENNFYTSCLGDYINWTDFVDADGNPKATGAYAEELFSYGDFTGVTKYKNTVILTKKNMMYECYGNKPPYRINLGANTGCVDNRSIVEVGGTLYFLGADGVYRYSGGLPVIVSHKINDGFGVFESGIGATDGRRYYLYAESKTDGCLLVYDTLTGIWCKEDNQEIVDMAAFDNQVYALTKDGVIYKFKSGNENVLWELQTKEFDLNTSSKKIPQRITLEADGDINAKLDVGISYDGGEFKRVATYTNFGKGIVDIRLKNKVCDRFKIKISGQGNMKLLSLACDVISSNKTHNKDYLIKY